MKEIILGTLNADDHCNTDHCEDLWSSLLKKAREQDAREKDGRENCSSNVTDVFRYSETNIPPIRVG